ncbi:hypothetical protein [Nocardia nova]|uniref:hypothetical protein n=1 Tax=Nocardia nova TaxID=37330 RepID=UPI0033F66C18
MYTSGTITIPTCAIDTLIAAVNEHFDFDADLIDVNDLAHCLYATATRSIDDQIQLGDQAEANAHGDTTTITLITEGSEATEDNTEWRELLLVTARHGADGTFHHEGDDKWRIRIADGAVHDDLPLEDVYQGDIITYVGQMQAGPGRTLDPVCIDTEANVIVWLLDQLGTRPDAGPRPEITGDQKDLITHWAQRAGIDWTIHPVVA